MLYKFNILFLLSHLNYKTRSISSLSSSSTVQHTIKNSSTYVHECFEFIFVAFVSVHLIHILTNLLPHILNFIQVLPIVLTIIAYYADIMLNAFAFPLCLKLYWHNRLKPNTCTIYKYTPIHTPGHVNINEFTYKHAYHNLFQDFGQNEM